MTLLHLYARHLDIRTEAEYTAFDDLVSRPPIEGFGVEGRTQLQLPHASLDRQTFEFSEDLRSNSATRNGRVDVHGVKFFLAGQDRTEAHNA